MKTVLNYIRISRKLPPSYTVASYFFIGYTNFVENVAIASYLTISSGGSWTFLY